MITNQALYQLSYSSNRAPIIGSGAGAGNLTCPRTVYRREARTVREELSLAPSP